MSAPHADQIINGYVARLRQAVVEAGVPPDQGREIVDDIVRHIAEARAAFPDETDADLLNLIERLGDPAAIVADERQRATGAAPAIPGNPLAASGVGLMEVAAVVLMVIFWPLGIALVMVSPVWTRREKQTAVAVMAAALLAVFLLLPLIFGLAVSGGFEFGFGHLFFAIIPISFFVAPIAGIYLAIRLGKHRRMMPA